MKKNRPEKRAARQIFGFSTIAVCLLSCLIVLVNGTSFAEQGAALPGANPATETAQQGQATVPPQQDPSLTPAQEGQSAEDLAALEEENTKVAQALEELLKSMNLGDFEYQTEERPDPFLPFISEKIVQSADSESEFGEKLTGMRQFEPGQLTLTAIIFTETNPMAMVEDSSHKGYVIRRGTKIGKFGIVTDILPNAVVIKQSSYSLNQENKYTTVEMILRKEGEK